MDKARQFLEALSELVNLLDAIAIPSRLSPASFVDFKRLVRQLAGMRDRYSLPTLQTADWYRLEQLLATASPDEELVKLAKLCRDRLINDIREN
jgi:hypothetical protein